VLDHCCAKFLIVRFMQAEVNMRRLPMPSRQQCAQRLANWWKSDSKSNAADQAFSALLTRSDKMLQIV